MSLKSVLSIALLSAVGIAYAQIPPTKAPPVRDARNMTVMIFWADPPRPPQYPRPVAKPQPSGSGVWIGRAGYIATCQHVIAGWPGPFKVGIARDPYVTEGTTSLSVTGMVNTLVATLVASDAATDVAILKAETPPSDIQFGPILQGAPMGTPVTPDVLPTPRGATLATEFPQLGETVYLAGFPIAEKADRTLIFQNGAFTGFYSARAAADAPAAHEPQREPPVSNLRFMLSLLTNPGDSGGPVINAEGKVVGLLEGGLPSPIRDERGNPLTYKRQKLDASGRPLFDANHQPILEDAPLTQNSGISIAVPARFIADLAKKNGINLD